MNKKIIYLFCALLFSIICYGQNLPVDYYTNSEKLEALYIKMLKTDSIEQERSKKLSGAALMAASNYSKIKTVARNLKFSSRLKGTGNAQLSELSYINNKLANYKSNYGVTVIVKFSQESFSKFKTDLTKVLLALIADGQSIENCIVAEVYGVHSGTSFDNAVGYKLYTLGEYASLNSLNNYTKLIENPAKSYQKEVFEDLDNLFSAHQSELENLSLQNAIVIGGDKLSEAMDKAGANACAFCKVCSASNSPQPGQGGIAYGDGFSKPIKIIQKNVEYNCVVATYDPSNGSVTTSLPSNLNPQSFGNKKIVTKGDQFVMLKKTVLNEDEYITCIATQQYNDYCTMQDPFSDQTFRTKVALEIQTCAQQTETEKQTLLAKFGSLNAQSQTYIFENGYLITKDTNGNTSIKSFSQSEYNDLIKDLKAGKLSVYGALVYKKTLTGYDIKSNYGSKVVPRQGYEMNGTAVDKSEIAFETVMNEFLQDKTNMAAPDIQSKSDKFEDDKRIDVKESTFWEKTQDAFVACREFIEKAEITENYYNDGAPDYSENWVNTPPLLSGVGNGVIEEVKEIPQLVFLACDIATKEEVRTKLWEGLKGMNFEKIKKAAKGTINNWSDKYQGGGDVAWHQGGKDGVMVFTIMNPAKLLKNADDVLSKNADEVAGSVVDGITNWQKVIARANKLELPNLKNKLDCLDEAAKKRFADDAAELSDDALAQLDDNFALLDEWKQIDALPTPTQASKKPAWLQKILDGNEFNRIRSSSYPNNELYLVNPKDPSKYVRLDSYVPNSEIVSRKYTQFSDIQESTGIKYIQELKDKYSPETKIADVPSNKSGGANAALQAEIGKGIKGDMFLEIPVQTGAIPQSVLNEANKWGIKIRDIQGKIY